MTKAKRSYFWDERVCPVCKKEFYPTPLHVYKLNGMGSHSAPVCSWSCVMRAEREREQKKKGAVVG
jgi:ssDNA-binding Zn-finger/Zn-ribbon topoisomerase 1